MDRAAAVAALPEVYRQAIALRDDGATGSEIARALEIEEASVGPLLEIGDNKLARLLDAGEVVTDLLDLPPAEAERA